MDWLSAAQHCLSKGSKLVLVDSARKHAEMTSLLQRHHSKFYVLLDRGLGGLMNWARAPAGLESGRQNSLSQTHYSSRISSDTFQRSPGPELWGWASVIAGQYATSSCKPLLVRVTL